jgi:thioredoxin reductase (NADPH)
MAKKVHVLVLGSGCAGLTAAIYAARANLSPVVLEGRESGGQLMWTTTVENFPGFPEGVLGPDLIDNMRQQAQKFGADTRFEHADSVDLSKRPFVVKTSEETYEADSLIVATGATARTLGISTEMHFMGYGVSTCATCDGAFYKDKTVAIVGGGDSAAEEGSFLTRFARKVYLIHRRDSLRASKIMADRILANPKVEPIWNTAVEAVVGTEDPNRHVNGLKLKNVLTGETSDLAVDGLFIAIGHKPNVEVFAGQLETTDDGYLLTRAAQAWQGVARDAGWSDRYPNYATATSVEGVFACGDVVDTHYRQAITAAGTGCAAAIDCEKWLETGHKS